MAKQIWTSCYGRLRWIPQGVQRVVVSRTVPQWFAEGDFSFTRMMELAPSSTLLWKAKNDPAYDWRAAFLTELVQRDLGALYVSLPLLCVLLCHEKDWENCHRKIAWDVFHNRFGCVGGEWPEPIDERKTRETQTSLFG